MDYVAITRDFWELKKYVTLVAAVIFVNNIPFLIKTYPGTKLVTVEHLPRRTANNLSEKI